MTKLVQFTIPAEATAGYGILLPRGHPPPSPVLIEMPCCGARFEFPTDESFPKETLPCPCGTPSRWVVFYESEGAEAN